MEYDEQEDQEMVMVGGGASDDDDHDNSDSPVEANPIRVRIPGHPMDNPGAMMVVVPNPGRPRYRECLKNHAVSMGGHVVDGCLKFMPDGPDGTMESMRCAACNCHRNFHRKEITFPGGGRNSYRHRRHRYHQLPPPPPPPPPHYAAYYGGHAAPAVPAGFVHVAGPNANAAILLPAGGGAQGTRGEDHPRHEEGSSDRSGSGGGEESSQKAKRFRTKFSDQQKEKMLEFAQRVGWKVQKHDEDALLEFCNEIGVKSHVLKVWMHNNKNTLGKNP